MEDCAYSCYEKISLIFLEVFIVNKGCLWARIFPYFGANCDVGMLSDVVTVYFDAVGQRNEVLDEVLVATVLRLYFVPRETKE